MLPVPRECLDCVKKALIRAVRLYSSDQLFTAAVTGVDIYVTVHGDAPAFTDGTRIFIRCGAVDCSSSGMEPARALWVLVTHEMAHIMLQHNARARAFAERLRSRGKCLDWLRANLIADYYVYILRGEEHRTAEDEYGGVHLPRVVARMGIDPAVLDQLSFEEALERFAVRDCGGCGGSGRGEGGRDLVSLEEGDEAAKGGERVASGVLTGELRRRVERGEYVDAAKLVATHYRAVEARVAKYAGRGSRGLNAVVDYISGFGVVPWSRVLEEALRALGLGSTVDYSYRRPPRRDPGYAERGYPLIPFEERAQPPRIAVVLDQSGSVSDAELAAAKSELIRLVSKAAEYGGEVVVYAFDTVAKRLGVYRSPAEAARGVNRVLGGGTNPVPAVERALEELRGEEGVLVIVSDFAWDERDARRVREALSAASGVKTVALCTPHCVDHVFEMVAEAADYAYRLPEPVFAPEKALHG